MSLQNLYGYNRNSASGTQYSTISGGSNLFSSESLMRSPWRATGVFRNFVILLRIAPGSGKSWTFTIRKNGSGTAATITIADTATTGSYTGGDITITDMDLVTIEMVGTGSPAATQGWSWVIEFEGTTEAESSYSWFVDGANTSPTNLYSGLFNNAGGFLESSPSLARQVISAPGSITGLGICVNSAPGVGNGLTAWVNLNGVRQDGTGGTVNTATALVGAITSVSADFSLPVVGGDLVYLEWDVSGAFTTRNWGVGVRFLATTPGESQVVGMTPTLTNSATEYSPIVSAPSVITDSAEADALNIAGITDSVLSRMYVLHSAAPGSGNTYTDTLRQNGGATAISVVVADAATTGSDLIHSIGTLSGDVLSLQTVPASTPTVSRVSWTMTQTILLPVMRVTQHIVEVICDEDLDNDPPEDVVACTGGGLVDEGVNPGAEVSLATTTAPLCWMEVTLQDGSPATVYRWAKMPIPHGEPKEARVLEFGTVTLALSDIDGGPETATITTRLQDVDGDIRALWQTEALLQARVDYYIADLATVIAELTPSRRFRGYISKCEPDGDRTFLITVEDALSSRLNAIDGQDLQSPTQLIEDNLGTLAPDAEMFDKPAPLVFGEVASATGAWPLKYVGSYVAPGYETLGALAWFLVSMGVCKVPDAWLGGLGPLPTSRIKLTETQFSAGLLYAPGHGGWIEANDWSERADRRWTLVAGKTNSSAVRLAIEGTIPILVNVCGLQSDQSLGSPHATVDSPARALLLYLNNYLAQDALTDFLPILEDDGISLFDTTTFEAVHDALEEMIGSGGVSAIAGVIGADYQQVSWRDRVAEFCRSFGYQFGVNRHGQGVLTVLDLTDGSADFAFTTRHVLDKSVRFPSRLPVENVIRFVHTEKYAKPLTAIAPPVASRLPVDPFAADWESGLQTVSDTDSIDALGGGTRGTRRSEVQEYSLSRDSVQSEDVATRRLNLLSPPNGRIEVTFAVTLRHRWDLRLGQVGTVEHWDMPWTGARRCQIQRLEENLDEFMISPTLRDVEDLLP